MSLGERLDIQESIAGWTQCMRHPAKSDRESENRSNDVAVSEEYDRVSRGDNEGRLTYEYCDSRSLKLGISAKLSY